MNKSIFIGRMATDPKVMSSAGKKTVAYFRIAVERNFKQEGAPNADYFSCVTFGERAEFVAKYFYKGKKIALEGEMHNDNYTGNSGEKVYGILARERCASRKAGGVGMRYTVIVNGKESHLYYEFDKWFMERRCS